MATVAGGGEEQGGGGVAGRVRHQFCACAVEVVVVLRIESGVEEEWVVEDEEEMMGKEREREKSMSYSVQQG